jgi:hypothetical protein
MIVAHLTSSAGEGCKLFLFTSVCINRPRGAASTPHTGPKSAVITMNERPISSGCNRSYIAKSAALMPSKSHVTSARQISWTYVYEQTRALLHNKTRGLPEIQRLFCAGSITDEQRKSCFMSPLLPFPIRTVNAGTP